MELPLIKATYKITRVALAEPGYAAALAVNIAGRDKKEYLLNIYFGEVCRRYLSVYQELAGCADFVEQFIEQGALVAVFRSPGGEPINNVFYIGARFDDRRERVIYAQTFLDTLLSLSMLPPCISCAALLSRSLQASRTEKRVFASYLIAPLAEASEAELLRLACDQLCKILLPAAAAPNAEKSFLNQLCSGRLSSVAQIYSAWLQAKPEILDAYEKWYAQKALNRAFKTALCVLRSLFRRGKGAVR